MFFYKKNHQKDDILTLLILIVLYFVFPFYIIKFFVEKMCLFLIDLCCLGIGENVKAIFSPHVSLYLLISVYSGHI